MRRHWLVIAGLLLCASVAQGQSAFVTSASGAADNNAAATTASFSSTSGHTIHAVALCRGAQTTATFSDNGAHSWTNNEVTNSAAAGGLTLATARAFNITGSGTHTVTITFGATCVEHVTLAIATYSGLTTTDPFDVDAGDTFSETATPTSDATATTTQANEMVVGSLGQAPGETMTAGSGYTKRVERCSGSGIACVAIEDKNVSSTGTQTADFTLGVAANSAVHVVAYKDAAAAAAPVRRPPVVWQ